jgi:hypothetical protein
VPDTISEDVIRLNVENKAGGDFRKRLEDAGYVSPQGKPFLCKTCDFFDGMTGYCRNREVHAFVEAKACCDFYELNGVGNPGS